MLIFAKKLFFVKYGFLQTVPEFKSIFFIGGKSFYKEVMTFYRNWRVFFDDWVLVKTS